MNTSNTFDISDVPAPVKSESVKSESTIASVRRMLKNAILISVRDSVLLKLAIVGFVLVALCFVLFLSGCIIYPHLIGHPCDSQEEYHVFYTDLLHRAPILFSAAVFPLMFIGTFIMNFLLLTLDSEIIRVWNGQKADFKRGWRTASGHLGSLATYSPLHAPINDLGLLSMCMVIPFLTRDSRTLNPFKMFWRSLLILKRIWKEFLLGIVGLLAILFWVFCTVIGTYMVFGFIWTNSPPVVGWFLFAIMESFTLIALCFALLCCNAYLCGQYIKASEGVEPSPEGIPVEPV